MDLTMKRVFLRRRHLLSLFVRLSFLPVKNLSRPASAAPGRGRSRHAKGRPYPAGVGGTVDGLVNAVIRPQVTGYLVRQDYKEGEMIRKGRVLFEIDPRPFQAALDQATGALRQAEAQNRNARENLARVKPLAAHNALSKRELDEATAAVRTTGAQVVAARAAVRTARLNLEFTKITSPIDGIAGIAQTQVGNLVGPAQTGALTTVSTIDPIKVYFSVPEQEYITYVNRSSSGADRLEQPADFKIELILSDGKVYPGQGKFYALDRQVDPRTGSLLVETTFPNPGLVLRPGQFGRVRVTVGTRRGALLVPQRAVNELQGRFQVAVVDPENKVEIKNVRPGRATASSGRSTKAWPPMSAWLRKAFRR